MVLRFTNTGSTTWSNFGPGATRLATLNYQASPFCDPASWVACNRPATLKETSVTPGSVGTFEFWYVAPTVASDITLITQFGVVSEAVAVMQGLRQNQSTVVFSPRYLSNYQSVQNYTDNTKLTSVPANVLNPGQRTFMILSFKNVGNIAWRNSGVGLSGLEF